VAPRNAPSHCSRAEAVGGSRLRYVLAGDRDGKEIDGGRGEVEKKRLKVAWCVIEMCNEVKHLAER
jgi:hypothetical protein